MKRSRTYTVGYLAYGVYVVCYEEGGRTWFLRDNDGKSISFLTEEEAEAYIDKGGLPHQEKTA